MRLRLDPGLGDLIHLREELAGPVLEMVAPQLRTGAVVLYDNTTQFARDYRNCLDYVRNPENGFRSMVVSDAGGFEFSVKLPSDRPKVVA